MNKYTLIQLILLAIILAFASAPFLFPAEHTPPVVTEYSYQSDVGDYIGAGLTQHYTPANAEFSLSGDLHSLTVLIKYKEGYWQIKLAPPKGEKLKLGQFAPIEITNYKVDKLPALSVSNTGLECNSLFGEFTIEQLITDSDEKVKGLALNFIQRCESPSSPSLIGRVQYQALINAKTNQH